MAKAPQFGDSLESLKICWCLFRKSYFQPSVQESRNIWKHEWSNKV